MDMMLILQYTLSLLVLAGTVFALGLIKSRLLRLSAHLSHRALRRRQEP